MAKTPAVVGHFARWRGRAVASLATTVLSSLGVLVASGQLCAETVRPASSSVSSRREAVAAIPANRLSPRDLARVNGVLADTTIYRCLPVAAIECDPVLYGFLIRHPEVIVNIWQVLGVSNVSLERTGPATFRAQDGHGAVGTVEVLDDDGDRQLVYAEGVYEGSLLRMPVRARCVLLLRSQVTPAAGGGSRIVARLDAFLQLDRAAAELLAKTFQPLVGRAADHNFSETMAFVATLSRTAERNPRGMQRVYLKLDRIEPDTRRQLSQLSDRVAMRAVSRVAPPEQAVDLSTVEDPFEDGP